MKLRQRRHYKTQLVYLAYLPLNDGGSVSGGNWYWRKKCLRSLRRQYTRMGLYQISAQP